MCFLGCCFFTYQDIFSFVYVGVGCQKSNCRLCLSILLFQSRDSVI